MIVLHDEIEEVVVKRKKKVKGVECDCCEKIILSEENKYDAKSRKYFKVTTGHHDWGNDSCDSIVDRDICPECITKFVNDYINKIRTGTEWIEIETCYVPVGSVWDDED